MECLATFAHARALPIPASAFIIHRITAVARLAHEALAVETGTYAGRLRTGARSKSASNWKMLPAHAEYPKAGGLRFDGRISTVGALVR